MTHTHGIGNFSDVLIKMGNKRAMMALRSLTGR
jgi:hypothetical protein